MNTLGESLKDAYEGDEARSRTRVRDPRRTVSAIRRRRNVRAAGTGTVAVLGVGAVGAIWMLAPGGRFAHPANSEPGDACRVSMYLRPAIAASGDDPFVLRAYVDLRPDAPDPKVVVVLADGTTSEVLPDAAGDYIYALDGKQYPLVFHDMGADFFSQPIYFDYDQAGNADFIDWDGRNPSADDARWSTAVPEQVPAGLHTDQLLMTLATTTLGGGSTYTSRSVPGTAYTEAVVTTAVGQEVTRLNEGDTMPNIDGIAGVESVALRVVGLPGDETFSIVATYHPEGAPLPFCEGDGGGLTTATSSPWPAVQPSADDVTAAPLSPGVSEGPEPSASAHEPTPSISS